MRKKKTDTVDAPAPAEAAPTPTKRAGGRPKKPDSERLEQFSIRLPPKLKYGLDFLARAQHRSLSQAVEWALQVGLHNYELGYTGGNTIPTIGSVVDDAWKHEHEADRLRVIYNQVPTLLAFEDFKACELVERSIEAAAAAEYRGGLSYKETDSQEAHDAFEKEGQSRYEERQEIYNSFVRAFWPAIRKIAVERANSGLSNHDVSIVRLLLPEEKSGRHRMNPFAQMKGFTLIATSPEITNEERLNILLPIHERHEKR